MLLDVTKLHKSGKNTSKEVVENGATFSKFDQKQKKENLRKFTGNQPWGVFFVS